MANKWSKQRLGDVCEINQSKRDSNWKHPFIEYIDISSVGVGHLVDKPNLISIKEAPSRAQRLVQDGDTIVSTVRPNRRSMLYIKSPKQNTVVSTGFAVLHPKKIDSRFLYYSVFDQEFTDYLTARADGSAYPAVSPEVLSDAELDLPPLPEQRAIAGILGALDDKIEVNRRMNATLEVMARAVFHQWFVENEGVGSWEIGQVKDLGEVITGKTPPTTDRENYDGEIPFITIPDMHGKMFVIETGKTLSEQGVQTQRNKTLPPFSICISCIATPGLVSMTTEPAQTNQQINSLIPKDGKSVFYSFFALRELGDEIRARGGGGSVLLNLNKGQFETMPISIPPVDLMHKFQEFAESLLTRLLANEKESRTLGSLRDSLLPKLMRGDVRVSVKE
jgi:type I restriction enzyme, S subunit